MNLNIEKSIIKGITQRQNGKFEVTICGIYIGKFSKKIDAVIARYTIEEIIENVLSHLEVEDFKFDRSNNNITIIVKISTGEILSINTGVFYNNTTRESSKKKGVAHE